MKLGQITRLKLTNERVIVTKIPSWSSEFFEVRDAKRQYFTITKNEIK